MKIKCALKNCKSVFEIKDKDTPSQDGAVRYICSHHTDEELRAAGILMTERTDKKIHFQDFAFDQELG